MICPHCNHRYRLSWSDYFRHPLSRHSCPQCKSRFKLQRSLTYILLLLGAFIVLASLPCLIVMFYTRNLKLSILTYLALSVLLVLPIDRTLDDRFRKSIPLEKKDEHNPE